MNLKLATVIVIINIVSITALSWRTSDLDSKVHSLIFSDFKVLSIGDKEVKCQAITDNAGVKQFTDIRATIEGGNLSFTIVVLPNDRNVELKYHAIIKLK